MSSVETPLPVPLGPIPSRQRLSHPTGSYVRA